MTQQLLQQLAGALVVAGVLAFIKFFRDLDRLKTTIKYDFDAIRTEVKPVVDWYIRTSMDALKIATNPTSERLTELADKYIASVQGKRHPKGEITIAEKQELIDGLRAIMRDPQQAIKRQSASMGLRFIEEREGLTAKREQNGH